MDIYRYIYPQNKRLESFVDENIKCLKESKPILDQIEKLEGERNKLALRIQKFKEKMEPLVNKEAGELGEYEAIANVDKKDGKIVITIVDKLELFKETHKKAKLNK